MKKSELMQIIKEEISNILKEEEFPREKWEITFDISIWRTLKGVDNLEDNQKEEMRKVFVNAAAAAHRNVVKKYKSAFDPRVDGAVRVAGIEAVKKHIASSRTRARATAPTKPETPQQAQPQEPKTANRSPSQGTLDLNIGPPRFREENGFQIATVTDSISGKSAEGRAKFRGNLGAARTFALSKAREKLLRMISGAQSR